MDLFALSAWLPALVVILVMMAGVRFMNKMDSDYNEARRKELVEMEKSMKKTEEDLKSQYEPRFRLLKEEIEQMKKEHADELRRCQELGDKKLESEKQKCLGHLKRKDEELKSWKTHLTKLYLETQEAKFNFLAKLESLNALIPEVEKIVKETYSVQKTVSEDIKHATFELKQATLEGLVGKFGELVENGNRFLDNLGKRKSSSKSSFNSEAIRNLFPQDSMSSLSKKSSVSEFDPESEEEQPRFFPRITYEGTGQLALLHSNFGSNFGSSH